MTEAKYTKHYFIEGERVVSKIGGGFDGAPYMPTDEPLEFISVAPDQFVSDLYEMVNRDINCTGDLASWKIEETIKPAHNDDDEVEKKQYFYHPDHLGSSSFITNAIGYAEQLPIAIGVQYLPFGELFVNQQNSTYDTRYKFSAKELDNETNYSYFGARYYDSDLSVFLSVDRYADKYP
ncbi:MAG: hypothetical protein JXR53_03410, partial [Bacteroidales bacterium]|nr:hypothetical protein [Bacteroidales bacterium]